MVSLGKDHLLILVGGYDSQVHVYSIKRGDFEEKEP